MYYLTNIIILALATFSAWIPGKQITSLMMKMIFRRAEKMLKDKDRRLTTSPLYYSQLSAYIGILERIIIVWLVMMEAIPAVTFLIILKSAARYHDYLSKNDADAAVFIIGTLCSFIIGIALGVGWKEVLYAAIEMSY